VSKKRGSGIGKGMGVGVLLTLVGLALVSLPRFFGPAGGSVLPRDTEAVLWIVFGVIQFAWMIPATLIFVWKDEGQTAAGIIIVACLVFVLGIGLCGMALRG
jgi:hypothetical protein